MKKGNSPGNLRQGLKYCHTNPSHAIFDQLEGVYFFDNPTSGGVNTSCIRRHFLERECMPLLIRA
jgi:hypothetical protein